MSLSSLNLFRPPHDDSVPESIGKESNMKFLEKLIIIDEFTVGGKEESNQGRSYD